MIRDTFDLTGVVSVNSYDTVTKYDLNPNYSGKNLKVNAFFKNKLEKRQSHENHKPTQENDNAEVKNERDEKWDKLNHKIKHEYGLDPAKLTLDDKYQIRD